MDSSIHESQHEFTIKEFSVKDHGPVLNEGVDMRIETTIKTTIGISCAPGGQGCIDEASGPALQLMSSPLDTESRSSHALDGGSRSHSAGPLDGSSQSEGDSAGNSASNAGIRALAPFVASDTGLTGHDPVEAIHNSWKHESQISNQRDEHGTVDFALWDETSTISAYQQICGLADKMQDLQIQDGQPIVSFKAVQNEQAAGVAQEPYSDTVGGSAKIKNGTDADLMTTVSESEEQDAGPTESAAESDDTADKLNQVPSKGCESEMHLSREHEKGAVTDDTHGDVISSSSSDAVHVMHDSSEVVDGMAMNHSSPAVRHKNLVSPLEAWDVGDIAELCLQLDQLPEGIAISYDKSLSLPAYFTSNFGEQNKLSTASVWPCKRDAIKANVEGKMGLFSLNAGLSSTVICNMNLRSKCIQDAILQLSDSQCIMFDAFCSGAVLQNVTFEGGIVACKGAGCSLMMEGCIFNFCTLVVVDGATLDLKNCEFRAGDDVGTGISVLVHWAETRVHASDCSFSGGLQNIAVHSGAEFQGHRIHCTGATIQAVEAKDRGTRLSMCGGCSITDVDITRQHASSRLYSKGVFIHEYATAFLEGCTITKCVRAIEVATQASATIESSRTRSNLDSGFRADTGSNLRMYGCSSEDDKHGCIAVGLDTRVDFDTVAVLRCKSDGFQIYSRKGGVAKMHKCSAQDGLGNGVWLSGFGGSGSVSIEGGWMQNNAKSGVQAWAGGQAEVKDVVTSGNGVCGFRSHGAGSVLQMQGCTSSDNVFKQELERGCIVVLDSSSSRSLRHS